MAEVMRDPEGNLWEERKGKWYPVESVRAGGMMAGADMGETRGPLGIPLGRQVGGAAVAAGDFVQGVGAGVEKLAAYAMGDRERVKAIDAARAEQKARYGGAEATGPGAAMLAGSLAPSLATLPLGLGIGGLATRGAGALAEQVLLGGGMAGMQHSGDQGMDAMVGALLGAGGWGTGQLAGKVMGAIHQRGVLARMAAMDQAEAQAGRAGGGGAPPGLVERADEIGGGGSAPPIHFGQAAGPVAGDVAAGVRLPGIPEVEGAAGLTTERARLIERGKEMKMVFTPGDETGNVAQRQIESSARSMPWARPLFEPGMRQNERVLNRSAVKALGEEGEAVTQQVLNNAHLRLGNVFEGVARDIGTVSGDALASATSKLEGIIEAGNAGAQITPEAVREARQLLKVWAKSGEVTGKRLLDERSALVQLSRDYSGKQGRGLAAQGVRDVVGVIDDLMEAGVPEGKAAMRSKLAEARGQWRILSALESGSSVRADGGVAAGSLFQALQREFPMEMRRGNFETVFGGTKTGKAGRDLMDVVRITQSFRDIVSDSGTATRLSLAGLLTPAGWAEALATYGGSKLYLRGGGLLAHEVASAPNTAPGLSGAAGGVARGLMGF